MRMLRSVLLFSLPFFLIGNELSATEWVPLDRDRPPADVANITDNPDDPPVCIAPGTDMVRVGWLDKDGVCTTAGTDKNAQEHTTGISILSVDSRWQWVSYDGEVPENIESLEKLPGVGHKTASVVMSQGFGPVSYTHLTLPTS